MNTDDNDLRFALRGLRQDIEPGRDLWPGIAARLEEAEAAARAPRRTHRWRRRWQPLALAASVALVALVGVRMKAVLDTPAPAAPSHMPLRAEAVRMTRDYQVALARMQGVDMPLALAPTVQELDRSADQILHAIDRDPHSPQLLQTLRYTYDRRLALTRRAALS